MTQLARLKAVRRRKALSQQQLAERAKVNRSTISRLENGVKEPFPTTVRKLAGALGVTPEELTEAQADDAVRKPVRLDHRVTVADHGAVTQVLQDERLLGALVNEATGELLTRFPGADLRLEVVADPDYGGWDQLFLGVVAPGGGDDAMEALRRFDEQWWIHHVGRARGRLCVDLVDR